MMRSFLAGAIVFTASLSFDSLRVSNAENIYAIRFSFSKIFDISGLGVGIKVYIMYDVDALHAVRNASSLRKDLPDLRDRDYLPSLRRLPPRLDPPDILLKRQFKVRDQGQTNSCTAQALAALLDFVSGDGVPVSADMLMESGVEVEQASLGHSSTSGQQTDGLHYLRSIVKGYYHNGVCSEAVWAGKGFDQFERDNPRYRVAKDARLRPLGAYYRVRSALNDFHSALCDVGAVLVAAEIHDNWAGDRVKKSGGKIGLPQSADLTATFNHAFVVVGYTEEGFLILNSWGMDWGGFPISTRPGAGGKVKRFPGVALWHYRDWAERILDAWVLRPGVPTPGAFEYSYGEHGIAALRAPISARSTPRHEISGHYLHLDDGHFVTVGKYPTRIDDLSSRPLDLIEAVNFVNQGHVQAKSNKGKTTAAGHSYDHVLVWIAGGDESTDRIVSDIAITRTFWKEKGIFPISVFWCSDFVEKAFELLGVAFAASLEQVGAPGPALDARIEIDNRGPGRAFWRDIKRSAQQAAKADLMHDAAHDKPAGALHMAFGELANLNPRVQVHVIAEGAGAIAFCELLRNFAPRPPNGHKGSVVSRIRSITLLAPAATQSLFECSILRLRKDLSSAAPIVRLITPSADVEHRMRTGFYSASILELVQMAFEEGPPVREIGRGTGQTLAEAIKSSRIIGLFRNAQLLCRDHGSAVEWFTFDPALDQSTGKLRDVTFDRNLLHCLRDSIVGANGGKQVFSGLTRMHPGGKAHQRPGFSVARAKVDG
jgi:hypothetical protein